MKFYSYPTLIVLMSATTAFASVNIGSPSNGEHVSSPFTLNATSTSCSSQPVGTMGYSIDNGDTTMVHNTSLDSQVSAAAGSHTVHVKAWGDKGAVCVSDVTIDVTDVTDDPVANTSVVPSDAISVSALQKLGGWFGVHDRGTPGSSSGSMSLVGSPAYSGSSRRFVTGFSNSGGERYTVSFGDNATSTNFFYDAWVYFTDSASKIGNLELDLYQVMSNGEDVIMGVQCDGYTGTWDYTENLGTPSNPKGHWGHSGAACNPRSWTRNKWHHIQASYSRSSTGKVTYKAVYMDGVEHALNVTVPSAYASGWSPTMLTNFQIDGLGSGTVTAYLDDLTIKRW